MIESDDRKSYAKLKLFEYKHRDYIEPSRRAETTYSFLDRSSLPEYGRVRRMLERWVERLPMEQRKRAVANMRHRGPGSGKEESQFYAAFFELFLHEFLLGTGGEVAVEPKIDGLTPDFRVIEELAGDSQTAYVVEASDIDLERGTALEKEWNELSAIDALNEIVSQDFYLFVKTRGRLESPPRKKDLKRPFKELAGWVNYEELLLATRSPDFNFEHLPTAVFVHGNWSIVGQLYPISPEHRQERHRFVGVWSGEAGHIDDIGKTKNRLYRKARRYKNVGPLLIALRCGLSNTRLGEVLFGSQVINFYFHKDQAETGPLPEPQYSQKRDGFWWNSSGPQNQNVIGIVTFYGVHPYSLDKIKAVFYANPYVNLAMPAWTNEITHADYSNGEFTEVPGLPPSKFLNDYEIVGNPFG